MVLCHEKVNIYQHHFRQNITKNQINILLVDADIYIQEATPIEKQRQIKSLYEINK